MVAPHHILVCHLALPYNDLYIDIDCGTICGAIFTWSRSVVENYDDKNILTDYHSSVLRVHRK